MRIIGLKRGTRVRPSGGSPCKGRRRLILSVLLPVSALLLEHHVYGAEDVKVLYKAPSRGSGCSLTVFRSETEIKERFTRLCQVEVTERPFFAGYDATGQAAAAVENRACGCGANGLVVLFNSSEHTDAVERISVGPNVRGGVSGVVTKYRPFETVRATAVFLEPKPNTLKPGFRDLEWGAPLDERFVRVDSEGAGNGLGVHARETDVLKVGGFTVSSIRYLTRDNRLAGVRVVLAKSLFSSVKNVLEGEWGPARKCDAGKVRCRPAGIAR